ncbi:MAG TPA: PTS sugar transporter subunit IIA [Candidatus Cloacimonas sp.]|nr:MAG: PTS system fructose-specific EIIABC component [Candidatus Cloacimonetes bacterium ADurb.Bin089]HPB18227.1 PTS sugar transporter subunit IIA [Candidatus Cloacimonas sp.]HQO46939.1 PTS sugar transporter subunit IIA [Candidatus Cloacimonas sp.]
MNKLFMPELIKIVEQFENKNACLQYMANLLSESGCLSFPDRFLAAVKGREEIMSTGIGRGIAIPHARDLTVSCLRIAVCLVKQDLEFTSLDNSPVHLVFMIAVPQSSNQDYMKILRSLSEFLRQDENREILLQAKDERDLYEKVQILEEKLLPELGI